MTQWQPIETAPKDGRTILLGCNDPNVDFEYDRYGAGSWESFGPYQEQMGAEGVWEHFMDYDPTHWMPLPPLPHRS